MLDQTKSITSSGNQVGYFRHQEIEEKHMGAILITDQIGVPVEFKYTEPVVATKLHKILYGSALEKYLRETVIRDRLGSELKKIPQYFITTYDEKEFLNTLAGREMMAVQKCAVAPESGSFTRLRPREVIVELKEDHIFLRLAFSTADEAVQLDMVEWLQTLSETMDVLEPLDRISSALTNICGETKRV